MAASRGAEPTGAAGGHEMSATVIDGTERHELQVVRRPVQFAVGLGPSIMASAVGVTVTGQPFASQFKISAPGMRIQVVTLGGPLFPDQHIDAETIELVSDANFMSEIDEATRNIASGEAADGREVRKAKRS